MKLSKSYLPDPKEIERKYYLVDAKDIILGRLAAKVATILRGKHKTIYTPHLETGDSVIVINASKIKVSGKKLQDKIYQKYSGYPSGQRCLSLEQLLKKSPEAVIRSAVDRMIPRGRLGYAIRTRLRVYAGDKHPHQAQKPIPLVISEEKK